MDRNRLPRVEFETNERLGVNVFDLNRERSLADLQRIGEELRPGLRVLLFEPGELEVEAVLGFDPEWQTWFATAYEATIVSYY